MIIERKGDKLHIDLQALDVQFELTRSSVSPNKFAGVIEGNITKKYGNQFGNMFNLPITDLAIQYLIGSYELLLAGIDEYIDRHGVYVSVEVTEVGYKPVIKIHKTTKMQAELVLCEDGLVLAEDENRMGPILAEKKLNSNKFRIIAFKNNHRPLIIHHTQSRPGFVNDGKRILVWSFSEEVDYLEVNWDDIDFDLIREIDNNTPILV